MDAIYLRFNKRFCNWLFISLCLIVFLILDSIKIINVPYWSLQKYFHSTFISQHYKFLTTVLPSLNTTISNNYISVVFFLKKKVISSLSTLWSFRENWSFSEFARFAEIHRNAHHSSCSTGMHHVLSYLISTPWMLLSIIELWSGVLSKEEHSQQFSPCSTLFSML